MSIAIFFNQCIYFNLFFFFPDLPTPKTTSLAPLNTTTPGNTQFTQEHAVTAQPPDTCSQNITVVYPTSRFCTNKRDGVYVTPKSPKSFYVCLGRKTFLTKCHIVVPQPSSAITMSSLRDSDMTCCVFVTLFHLLNVWINR